MKPTWHEDAIKGHRRRHHGEANIFGTVHGAVKGRIPFSSMTP
jgi:hypothetical protein